MTDYNAIKDEIAKLNNEIDVLEKTLVDDDDWRSVKETENDIHDLRRQIMQLEEMLANQKSAPQPARPSHKPDASRIAEMNAARDALRERIDLLDDNIDNRMADLEKENADLQQHAQESIERDTATRNQLQQELTDLENELKRLSQNTL